MLRSAIILLCLSSPGAAQAAPPEPDVPTSQTRAAMATPAGSASPSTSNDKATARTEVPPREPTEEETERFREAFRQIDATTEVPRLTAAMATLREAYPLSRAVIVEMAVAGSPKSRTFAIQILGEYGTAAEDLPVVTPALQSARAGTRLAAVMAIRKLGKEGFRALVAYLPNETVDNNKKMAIKTLQQWEDPQAMPILITLLRREKDLGVRNFLATALCVLSKEDFGQDADRWQEYWNTKQRQEQAAALKQLIEGESADAAK